MPPRSGATACSLLLADDNRYAFGCSWRFSVRPPQPATAPAAPWPAVGIASGFGRLPASAFTQQTDEAVCRTSWEQVNQLGHPDVTGAFDDGRRHVARAGEHHLVHALAVVLIVD